MIERVGSGDLDDLLPLLRGYCDFYEVAPRDDALRALCETLIANPETADFSSSPATTTTGRRSASRRSSGPTRPSRRAGSRS